MSETAKKETIIGYITLEDGTKKEVLEQKGKFYICKDTSYFTWRYPLERVKNDTPKTEKKDTTKSSKPKTTAVKKKGTVNKE